MKKSTFWELGIVAVVATINILINMSWVISRYDMQKLEHWDSLKYAVLIGSVMGQLLVTFVLPFLLFVVPAVIWRIAKKGVGGKVMEMILVASLISFYILYVGSKNGMMN